MPTPLRSGSADGTVLLYRAASHDIIQKVGDGKSGHGGAVHDVRFTAKGKAFITACADALVRIWQIGTGNVVRVLRGHTSAVTGVCFSPLDGRLVCTVGADCSARVWRVDNGLMLKNLGSYDVAARHSNWVRDISFHSLYFCNM
jgi:WD40 repeat protein